MGQPVVAGLAVAPNVRRIRYHFHVEWLIRRAEECGLRVVFRDLGRRSGEIHSTGVIFVNHRKSLTTQMVTIAHECGHWALGHDWRQPHDREQDERAADEYAARMLITFCAYRDAEREVGPHPGALAVALGVPRHFVELRAAQIAYTRALVAPVVDEFDVA